MSEIQPPVRHQITVEGTLGRRWSAPFDGLQLTSDAADQTTITGPVTDPAALPGLLAKLRDLGLPLLAPGPLRRLHQRIGISETTPQPYTPAPAVRESRMNTPAATPTGLLGSNITAEPLANGAEVLAIAPAGNTSPPSPRRRTKGQSTASSAAPNLATPWLRPMPVTLHGACRTLTMRPGGEIDA